MLKKVKKIKKKKSKEVKKKVKKKNQRHRCHPVWKQGTGYVTGAVPLSSFTTSVPTPVPFHTSRNNHNTLPPARHRCHPSSLTIARPASAIPLLSPPQHLSHRCATPPATPPTPLMADDEYCIACESKNEGNMVMWSIILDNLLLL